MLKMLITCFLKTLQAIAFAKLTVKIQLGEEENKFEDSGSYFPYVLVILLPLMKNKLKS